MRSCNQAGKNIIQGFEGRRLQAYQDTRGIWTIGWGHTGPEVSKHVVWSVDKCEEQFLEDLNKFETGVDNLASQNLNPNQFSALVCFSYNLGIGSLASSTLLKLANQGDYNGAGEEFLKWDHNHDGSINPGLTRRREAERDLFLRQITT